MYVFLSLSLSRDGDDGAAEAAAPSTRGGGRPGAARPARPSAPLRAAVARLRPRRPRLALGDTTAARARRE
eukprot:3082141-Pyramimonas_sp.AAC.1